MAVPVKFADVGKSVSDLLKADYSPFSVELNTATLNGVKFTSTLKKSDASKPLAGELKAKYFDAAHGVTFNYSFNTDRKLVAKTELADSIVKGLRVDAEASIQKSDKDSFAGKGMKFGVGFKQEHINTNAAVDVLSGDVPINADLVIGYEGISVGAEAKYSLGNGKLSNVNTAISYAQPDYVVSVHATPDKNLNISTVTAAYFHQLSIHLAAGAKLQYNLTSGDTLLSIGTQYQIDPASSLKASATSGGIIGLQYSQKLRPGVKATFGTTINWAQPAISADTGFSLTFDV